MYGYIHGLPFTYDHAFSFMQLIWYDSILRQDSYMMGATIFLMDGTSDWESFSINGPTADLLTQYLKSQTIEH